MFGLSYILEAGFTLTRECLNFERVMGKFIKNVDFRRSNCLEVVIENLRFLK